MKRLSFVLMLALSGAAAFAQSHISTQPHQAQVTSILPLMSANSTEISVVSSGDDGFLIKWTKWTGDEQGDHYQISDMGIKMIATSPNGTDIAIYESDGGSVNKLSVYDWKTLKRKFFKRYTDSITSLSFSAKGKYLMIGTATVDGLEFRSTSNWQLADKIKTNTSIVNYVQTSDTEKTCVLYSPAGSLTYYDMTTGKEKQKFKVAQGLSQVVLFNNNTFLAGVKDDQLYVVHAYKGTTLASIPMASPIILSSTKDSDLYYLEYDGKSNYELKLLESMEGQKISNPRSVRTFRGPRGAASICCGCKVDTDIYLGGRNGAVYKAEAESSITTISLEEITKNMYSKILDVATLENDFLFLTADSLYRLNYATERVDRLASVSGQTQLISYDGENVILWSKASRNPVVRLNLETQKEEVLFTPKTAVQNIRYFRSGAEEYLVEIESSAVVNVFDLYKRTLRQLYSGSGIQDAVLCADGRLYISKSATAGQNTPLLCVDMDTQETVPLAVKGNVSFGLSTNGKIIYGIDLVSENNETVSYVYSYNIDTKQATNILKFSEEDSDAFTYLDGTNLFTNIGKNKVYCYNISAKKRFNYERSASIPAKVCANGRQVVILNSNGSISWATSQSANLIENWFLTTDGNWDKF